MEDTGGALGSGIVLGVDMDVRQEVDIAAVTALDTDQIAGVDMGLHMASGPGRRHHRGIVEHSSRSGV